MHIEFLVEERSAEEALRILVPQIIKGCATFDVHPFQGKQDLLGRLLGLLRGYKHWPPDSRIVVLLDKDDEDCVQLKRRMEQIAQDAGLSIRATAGQGAPFQVLLRIAIEELEAWFFGDVEAMVAAYPRMPRNLAQRATYRRPDEIRGGTWEALERELQKVGYHPGGLQKIQAAADIAQHMDPQRNRSPSFRIFRKGLLEMIGCDATPTAE